MYSGVGTTATPIGNVFQGAFGEGKCKTNSHPDTWDEIILVGFSRGGFTVRCLAAFIDKVGLLRRHGLALLETLFTMWKQQKSEADKKKLDKLVDDLESNNFLFKPGIKVLAEWDTVSAMGLHIWAPEFSFVSDIVPKCVESAFHAMSIHERRFEFEPMPYRRGYEEAHTEKTRTVRQCLFVGCHFDIGGGNEDAGLSMLPFLWMVDAISSASSARFSSLAIFGYHVPLAINSKLNPSLWHRSKDWVMGKYHETEKPVYTTCSSAKGYLQPSHRGLWQILKWKPWLGTFVRPRGPYWTLTYDPASHRTLAIRCMSAVGSLFSTVRNLLSGAQKQHAVGKQKPPEDERTLAIEVHWTVRMLQKRIPNGAGCLPGYDLQGLDEDPHGREGGLPHYIWRKRCDSKQQSSPNADSEAILHEFRPSKSESELYKEWSEYDGKEKDRKSHRVVYDKRWMNALRELSLKPEPPVLKGRKREETMREWFRDLYPEINELSEEGTRLESESNPEGTADALGQ
ncbi:uncharacterized protein J4E87_009845 [Alternaria ethzedia]|uniref:uncharacterized protein n=1 Tax=Alternaria ethzedia TaxID=181014 RepID=UPI0020C4A89C|nr:uncharacterized protein J4E87_009845 [Alternaria ethzedia]KAI4613544.1 hypothetical protein J4E87_009845 [Alternaria ethzedia]